jgi:fluoroacetyl-CoA thioesterase
LIMKNVFKPGDKKQFNSVVKPGDVAAFHNEVVHPVCATFSLARDIEWTTRQFVLEMRDEDEEGVGTFLSIDHKGPAFVGEEIKFTAWIDHIEGNELQCFYEAKVGDRLIAVGKTGQKILKREKLKKIFGTE